MYKRILIPKKYNLTWKKDNTAIAVQEKIIGNEVEYSILLDNVDAIMYDNNEPDWFDLTPRIHFTSFKNWKEVIDWALPSYSIDSNTQNEIESLISKDSKNLNLDDFLNWSIRFVQDEIRYLGFESGLNAYKPHNPTKVFKQRFGDCKDKSLLLVSFLKTRGIDAFPVLVNTRLRKETKNRLPSFFQFDHCIIGFYKEDKLYFIDPTINNQGGNWDSRYISDYGYGLFISNNFNNLSEIAQLKGGEINETQEIEIAGLEGEAMMRVVTVYTGHEADYQRSYFQSNSKEKILKQYITYYGNLYSDIEKFDDLTFTDDRVKNIFTITEKYKIPTFWKPYNEDGSIVYCEFYPITLETYFNVSKSTSKKSPYQISYPVSY
ncbi:MAG: hypothetical protein O9262_09045, partial [Cyclobacteriaceae bacterium]|nr:hypothetical protein [Cyclobacteriaceae bacterium]